MNGFQKKCFVAVAGMHGLLLLVLIVGTAFLKPEKKIEPSRVITLVNFADVTDGPTRGGGSPAPAPAPVPVVQEVKRPDPIPQPVQRAREPEPKPEPPKPIVETKPEPKKIEPVPRPTPVVKPTPEPVKPKRNIDISKTIIRKTPDKRAATEAANKAALEREKEQKLAAVTDSLKNIGKNLSSSTSIETSGFGGDGQAAINYGDLVLSKYDAAWFAPAEVDDNEAIVKARVIIARSGNVISATIIKPSGNAILDQSVRRALELKFIKEFPPGSKDSQRTYIINFNLKSKRGIG